MEHLTQSDRTPYARENRNALRFDFVIYRFVRRVHFLRFATALVVHWCAFSRDRASNADAPHYRSVFGHVAAPANRLFVPGWIISSHHRALITLFWVPLRGVLHRAVLLFWSAGLAPPPRCTLPACSILRSHSRLLITSRWRSNMLLVRAPTRFYRSRCMGTTPTAGRRTLYRTTTTTRTKMGGCVSRKRYAGIRLHGGKYRLHTVYRISR